MRERSFDNTFYPERVRIHLSDSSDARIGCDFNDQRILATVALNLNVCLTNVYRLNAGYFHLGIAAIICCM